MCYICCSSLKTSDSAVHDKEREQQRKHRNRVLKQGSIIRGTTFSDAVCMVRNMSDSGAELKIGIDQEVPEEFLLYVRHDGIAYRCKQRWRDGTRMGVEIIGKEEKPSWHYG